MLISLEILEDKEEQAVLDTGGLRGSFSGDFFGKCFSGCGCRGDSTFDVSDSSSKGGEVGDFGSGDF